MQHSSYKSISANSGSQQSISVDTSSTKKASVHILIQLRSFLGAVNYYGKFIKSMKELRGPLDNLLRKESHFTWHQEHEEAFINLKKILASNLVLTHYDPKKKLVLASDASDYGMGATLMHQFDDGSLRPIMCWSGTFNEAEKGYSQIDKEARAFIFGLKKAHSYIAGRRFTVQIDHKPLLRLFGGKHGIPAHTAARLQRFAIIASAYDFNIQYVDTNSFGYAEFSHVSFLITANSMKTQSSLQ